MKVGSYIPSAHISGHFDFDFSFLTLNKRLKTSGSKRLGNIWFNMVLFHFFFFFFFFYDNQHFRHSFGKIPFHTYVHLNHVPNFA